MTTARGIQQEIRQNRPFASRAQEATVAILRTADVVRRRLASVIEPHGVTLQQYNVLRILRGAGGQPMPTLEIADRLIERTPGVTRLLDRLEAKELVRRERCADDRRLVHCWITPAGLTLLASLDDAVDRADEDAMRGVAQTDLATLLGILGAIRAQA